MPLEYCSFNDKKTYKQCIKILAKKDPKKADQLAANTVAPIIEISKCGINRLNGFYEQKSKKEAFCYVNLSDSTMRITRRDINELSMKRIWCITEESQTNSDFIIVHYTNHTLSSYPPLKRWRCIAGIRPSPFIKHIDAKKLNKFKPTKPMSIAEQKASKKLKELWMPYPKISNLMSSDFIKQSTQSNAVWIATEKVHGANLSIITDGKVCLPAKRTSILNYFDGFYNGWQSLVESQKKCILKAYAFVKKNIEKSVMAVIVYGELFGGSDSGKFARIQKGINYSPQHHFYPFDVLVIGQNENRYFLPWNETSEVFERCGFRIYAKSVVEGSLQQILNDFDANQFETTIPQRLGLPKPSKNHIAEGIVIRTKTGKRLCVKYKADKFGEIGKFKQSELRRNASLPSISLKILKTFDGDKSVIDFIHECVNENRLNSAISKIGQINKENLNMIAAEFTNDVLNEIKAFHQSKMKSICDSDKNAIRHFITEIVREFVHLKYLQK